MISGESETSCPGRRAICARRTRQIKEANDKTLRIDLADVEVRGNLETIKHKI